MNIQPVSQFALRMIEYMPVNGNWVMSPTTVASAFVRLIPGARGQTASQLRRVFGLSILNDAKGYLKSFEPIAPQNGVKLTQAVALFAQNDYNFRQAFLDSVGAESIHPIDFQTDPEAARQTVNRWVEVVTNELIKDLVPSGGIDPLTVLVSVAGSYFKGNWASQFDKQGTYQGRFRMPDGFSKPVTTMSQTGRFGYYADQYVNLISLPYSDPDFAFVGMVPNWEVSISDLKAKLADPKYQQLILNPMEEHEVAVHLPRKKMEWGTVSLKPLFQKMGVYNAFDSDADFSGMTGYQNLVVSDVFQKATIAFDELGTTAAAAAAVVMREKSLGSLWIGTQPFYFFLVYKGIILFQGLFFDPESMTDPE